MWNITPDDVERIREELKGRRAAIQARYEDEIEKLKAELDDIEVFERTATEFARKHKRKETSASVEPDPIAPLEALPTAADVVVETKETECSDAHLDNLGEIESSRGAEAHPVTADAGVMEKAPSRWRVHI